MAGLVHAAAAGSHEGDPFLDVAVLRLRRAPGAVGRGGPPAARRAVVIALGLLFNAGAVAVWALTRSVGIPFVDSLAEVEAVGTPDLAGRPVRRCRA